MKTQLTETHTITGPENRIWIVRFQDGAHRISLTYFTKKAARAFKEFWDNQDKQPLISISPAV